MVMVELDIDTGKPVAYHFNVGTDHPSVLYLDSKDEKSSDENLF